MRRLFCKKKTNPIAIVSKNTDTGVKVLQTAQYGESFFRRRHNEIQKIIRFAEARFPAHRINDMF